MNRIILLAVALTFVACERTPLDPPPNIEASMAPIPTMPTTAITTIVKAGLPQLPTDLLEPIKVRSPSTPALVKKVEDEAGNDWTSTTTDPNAGTYEIRLFCNFAEPEPGELLTNGMATAQMYDAGFVAATKDHLRLLVTQYAPPDQMPDTVGVPAERLCTLHSNEADVGKAAQCLCIAANEQNTKWTVLRIRDTFECAATSPFNNRTCAIGMRMPFKPKL